MVYGCYGPQLDQAGMQGLRPERERNLPQYELDRLDRVRALNMQRRSENPGLYEQLDRIEAKLDQLLAGEPKCDRAHWNGKT